MNSIQLVLILLICWSNSVTIKAFLPNDPYTGNSTYKGCWLDDKTNRDLSGQTVVDPAMTIDKCLNFCSIRGYKYAGVQNRGECWCDNDQGKYSQANEIECQCPCVGDFSLNCGCELRQKVYEINDPSNNQKLFTGLLKFMGCYRDNENSRDMNGASKYFPGMTPDKCFHFCKSQGFKYAGLQNGDHCYCDNDYGSYEKLENSDCECSCVGNTYQVCGCNMATKVMEIKDYDRYENPTCNFYRVCSCSGEPHCHSFDHISFSLHNPCEYDLISTHCYGSSLPSNLVHFNVKQGIERSNGSLIISFVEIQALGKVYRFLKSTADNKYVFTVDGLTASLPYTDAWLGVKIFPLYDQLIFEADFGLKLTWSGTISRADFHLCDAYTGSTCGLCGNSDDNQMLANEFVDRFNKPVQIGTDIWDRFHDWEHDWLSDPSDSSCISNIGKPVCNETYYRTNFDYCGTFFPNMDQNNVSPWAFCLWSLNWEIVSGYVDSCVIEMCKSEGNPAEQKRKLCDVYADFDLACLEADPYWMPEWRQSTNCDMECPSDRVYDVRDGCPKTCNDPDGTKCNNEKFVEGCFCKDGFLLNSEGLCVDPSQCGCYMPNSDYIIPVGGVVISSDCSKLYRCDYSENSPNETEYRSCSENAYCLNVNNQPSCKCKEGFTGDGYDCDLITTCEGDYCYGFGDPHYTAVSGRAINLNNTCSYVLVTDSIAFVPPTYSVVVDQEHRFNGDLSFMKTIRIIIGVNEYTIKNDFRVNGARYPLPYTGPTFKVIRSESYIIFNDARFSVAFDGEYLLKVRICESNYYGLCRLQNDNVGSYPFANFFYQDSSCDL